MADFCSTWLEDMRHRPELGGNPRERAHQGDRDALKLADDVRQLDPGQVWGFLNRLGKHHPERLLAAVISLAARVDPAQHEPGRAPAWTEQIGGIPALHPDYDRPRSATPDPAGQVDQIVRYADSGLPDHEIARRTGLPVARVEKIRLDAGIRRRTTPGPHRTDDTAA